VQDKLQLVGRLLADKYRIDRLIGEGGAGWVYLAQNRFLDTPVAIKVLKNEDASGADVDHAFMKEAKLLFSLSHPSIVRIFDAGQVGFPEAPLTSGSVQVPVDAKLQNLVRPNQVSYVVFEFVDGISLDTEIRRRRAAGTHFEVSAVFALMRALLSGIAYAHNSGVVHRDIKPSNILVLRDGSVKILDFGTARTTNQVTQLTTHFTPRYAAPEQWDPSRGARGPWTDVYAVGLLLYEVLTLEMAAKGDDLPKLIESVMAAKRPTLLGKRDDVIAFESLISRSVALDIGGRFQDGNAMLAELSKLGELFERGGEQALRLSGAATASMPQRLPSPLAPALSDQRGTAEASAMSNEAIRAREHRVEVATTMPLSGSGAGIAALGASSESRGQGRGRPLSGTLPLSGSGFGTASGRGDVRLPVGYPNSSGGLASNPGSNPGSNAASNEPLPSLPKNRLGLITLGVVAVILVFGGVLMRWLLR
jgi:eukaryotic-like serine/threonine-protein kinase